jgi:hypothetical protein
MEGRPGVLARFVRDGGDPNATFMDNYGRKTSLVELAFISGDRETFNSYINHPDFSQDHHPQLIPLLKDAGIIIAHKTIAGESFTRQEYDKAYPTVEAAIAQQLEQKLSKHHNQQHQ